MDRPNPYNYNNDDNYSYHNGDDGGDGGDGGDGNKREYNKENNEFIQFMMVFLLLMSCSRACYECNKYLYQKIINSCNKNKLTCRRLNSTDEDKLLNECSICLEQYVKNEKVIELQCKHTYHEKCIKEWIDTNNASNNSCPICRESII